MNQYVEKTLVLLTGKSDLDYVTIPELEKLVSDHPYFTPAQVLLAQKLKATQSEGFLPQVQKTALYYTNPYLLHFNLLPPQPELALASSKEPAGLIADPSHETSELEVTEAGDIRFTQQELSAASTLAKDTLKDEEDNTSHTSSEEEPVSRDETTEEVLPELLPVVQPDLSPAENINEATGPTGNDHEKEDLQLAELNHPPVPGNFLETEESVNAPAKDLLEQNTVETAEDEEKEIQQQEIQPELSLESNFTAPFEYSQEPQLTTDVLQLDNPLIGKVNEENIAGEKEAESGEQGKEEFVLSHLSEQISHLENPADDIDKIDLPEPVTPEEDDEVPAPDPFYPEQEEILEEIVQENADKEEEEQASEQGVRNEVEKESHLHIPLSANTVAKGPSIMQQQAVENEPLIPIEPYYTVDYFASQGIKLTLEKNPKDKLGKQLRSFTDWLKHMKRLGPEDTFKTDEDPQMESRIQGIANSSNVQKDIITEAMAEVLEKQGKNNQAIGLYNKLSFLHPDKSTYFADKIKKLKGI